MNLKIQCPCGSRYSFDVEPQNGRMPFAVKCPVCGADGAEAANALIAEAVPPPQVNIPVARVAVPHVSTEANAAQAAETRRAVQELWQHKKAAEQRSHRVKLYLLAVVIVAVVGYAGFWTWYYFSGSKPHVAYETTFGSGDAEPAALFIASGRFVLVDNQHATLHDLKADKDLWTTAISPGGTASRPEIFAQGASIWACLSNEVVQLDIASGNIKRITPIDGGFLSFMPNPANILVVSAMDDTTRRTLRIDLTSGDSTSDDIVIPRPEKHQTPNQLPSNVQPTADVLMSQEMDEQKFSKTLDAQNSRIYSAGENLVELRIKLEEPKVTSVQSIKPDATRINGETTASTTIFGVSDDVFNNLKRSKTGGVKQIDESRYEVKLRRWVGPKPVEWTGETIGPPAFFPLNTVDLVVGGKTLQVFDKQNQWLFQANLSYPVADRYVTNLSNPGLVPAAEGPGGLYFFDQGVVTAFALPQGQVRWRLTTVGATKLQFDADGALYINSTTASPEDIQFSDSISFDKVKPVVIKVDPQNGKILWQKEGVGFDSFISGKYLYATSANLGGAAITQALKDSLGNVPEGDEPIRFHLYRLNPTTGQTMWDVYHPGVPEDLSFEENKFVLCYDHDVQAWRSLSF